MVKTPSWPADRFGALLSRILSEAALSQAQLAALVPMDQGQLSRWKSGKSRPQFDSLTALGAALQAKYPALGVGPDELLAAAGYDSRSIADSATAQDDLSVRILPA